MNAKSKRYFPQVVIFLLVFISISCEKALYEEDQPVTDIDGNIYKTVKIGNQVWMAENLKVTKCSDGTPITLITSQAGWDDISIFTKAYMPDEEGEYGVYYTGAAAINDNSGSPAESGTTQGLCPTGWHIPDYEEWTELVDFLGGSEVAGGKLKESGSVHWRYPNMKATNESGFTAFAGGFKTKSSRWIIASNYKKHSGYWWSSDLGGLTLTFKNGEASVYEGSSLTMGGKSVRCIKD